MFLVCPVFQSYRETTVRPAPKTMSGFRGSGATYPYSIAFTGCQSRFEIDPSLPLLAMQTEPLSCWAPQTLYGHSFVVITWYSCAVGWLYHELHVRPPLTVAAVP